MKDIRSLSPLKSSPEPARLGPGIPHDLGNIRRGSVALIVRRSGPNNDQEILLIKRTIRESDHWSGHLALPGGRQDPDESDLDTAIRETREEVGLDLHKTADIIGPLEPRLIRIKWGTKVVMVLCPFVFSLRDEHYDVKLVPQDSEVAAVFWYPLRALFDYGHRTWEQIPISARLNLPWKCLNDFIGWQIGDIMFDAVKVIPKLPEKELKPLPPTPWKMWGITWGLMQDLRRLVEPESSVRDIVLPTFKALDLRALLSAFSAVSVWRKRRLYEPAQADWTNKMLNGHFVYFPYAIVVGLILRYGGLLFVARRLWSKL